MSTKTKFKRLIAILLAITMVLTDISLFQDPTEVKAADDDNCYCHTSLKPHKVDGASIASWAQGSGKNTILDWHESTSTSKTAHIISFNGTYYLAWFQRNKTATSTAHYHTDGYHLTSGLYTNHSISIKGSNPDARIMEGEGFQQAYIGIVSGSPSEHYTLYYVDYDKVVNMCQALGLASKGSGTATYYEAYMQPYISCYDGSGTRRLNKGETYNLVYNMFCKLYSYSTQRDLIEKYNVKLRIPAIVLPVKLRIRMVGSDNGKSLLTYDPDGSPRIRDLGVTTIIHREEVNGGLTYSGTVDLSNAVEQLSKHIRSELVLYDEDKEKLGKGIFAGLHVVVQKNSTDSEELKKSYNLDNSQGVYFDYAALLEDADDITKDKKYKVFLDDRQKNDPLEGVKVTPERLIESIKGSCRFIHVRKDYAEGSETAITNKDVCYIDLVYVNTDSNQYKYEVTRYVADYNPTTGKYENQARVTDLIKERPVEENNITDDGKLKLRISTSAHPDYEYGDEDEEDAGKALGSVIANGHKYVLAKSKLSVQKEDKSTVSWENGDANATSWAGSSIETVGNNYAFETTALDEKIPAYRYITDKKTMESYGKSATWTVRNMYVCRPPIIQLNYKYDKTTMQYTLIDTVPDEINSADNLVYEYANSEVSRQILTSKNTLPLRKVEVGTGQIRSYDGRHSYSIRNYPILFESCYKKTITDSDRMKNAFTAKFTMPYDSTYLVCVYGDEPDDSDPPGYTRVILDKSDTGYSVRSSEFVPSSIASCSSIEVNFDTLDLDDVGYTYADRDKPTIPSSFTGKPEAEWGQEATATYDYVGPDTPDLNKNLVVYAVYESKAPGYTKVLLKDDGSGNYYVSSSRFIQDSNRGASRVSVSFTPNNLVDVGYSYASSNKPDVPVAYSGKPSAVWGQSATTTYNYSDASHPSLNQNLIVYGIYRDYTPDPYIDRDSDVVTIYGPDPQVDDMQVWIKNDYRNSTSPDYDVETAIPTSEYQNVYAMVKKYLARLDQRHHTKKWSTTVTVTEYCYVTDWYYDYEDEIWRRYYRYTGSNTYSIPVERKTYFYTLLDGNVQTPINLLTRNKTLTLAEQVSSDAQNKYWENGQLLFRLLQSAETKDPWYRSSTTVTSIDRTISYSEAKGIAEGCVGQFTSHNDVIEFGNGEGAWFQLSDATFRVSNLEIQQAPAAGYTSVEVGSRVFDEWGVFIPANRANSTYDSQSTVTYRTWKSTMGASRDIQLDPVCNSVTVHTPVVCNCYLVTEEDKVQKIQPTASKNLVLDTSFKVHCSAEGPHRNYPGYGDRDYQKWLYVDKFDDQAIRAMQVKFPFAVMRQRQLSNGNIESSYYLANTWIPVPIGDTEFYVPSWESEVDFTAARWRAIAENAEVLSSYSTDDGRTLKDVDSLTPQLYNSRYLNNELSANLNSSNYTAWNEEVCSVSGRVYQMAITDITDYPTWENVFRTGNSSNPNELTGFKYTSGLTNRDKFSNGSVSESTLPTVKGSNAYDANAGILKPGYGFRYSLETVGMMEDSDDTIKIVPRFSWLSEDLLTRKDVDVYYTETFSGSEHQLVKIGSSLDASNKHALSLGDDSWGVPQVAIDRTAKARGYSSAKELMDKKEFCWYPGLTVIKANIVVTED